MGGGVARMSSAEFAGEIGAEDAEWREHAPAGQLEGAGSRTASTRDVRDRSRAGRAVRNSQAYFIFAIRCCDRAGLSNLGCGARRWGLPRRVPDRRSRVRMPCRRRTLLMRLGEAGTMQGGSRKCTTTVVRRAPPGTERGGDIGLVVAARTGDRERELRARSRYRGLIRCKARSYFLVGADRDDIIQEGMIGLFKAIRDYDPTRQASFRSFAELCVTRQIITRSSPRRGTSTRRSTATSRCRAPRRWRRTASVCSPTSSPPRRSATPPRSSSRRGRPSSSGAGMADALSPFETQVLRLYTTGARTRRSPSTLGRHTKAVDNALQRVKRKMETQIRRCDSC